MWTNHKATRVHWQTHRQDQFTQVSMYIKWINVPSSKSPAQPQRTVYLSCHSTSCTSIRRVTTTPAICSTPVIGPQLYLQQICPHTIQHLPSTLHLSLDHRCTSNRCAPIPYNTCSRPHTKISITHQLSPVLHSSLHQLSLKTCFCITSILLTVPTPCTIVALNTTTVLTLHPPLWYTCPCTTFSPTSNLCCHHSRPCTRALSVPRGSSVPAPCPCLH